MNIFDEPQRRWKKKSSKKFLILKGFILETENDCVKEKSI